MGEVLLALRREGAFERRYAVKRLRPALRADPAARTAFLDEARLAGLLYHPHLVRVFDVGEDADGPFMVMEYVDGLSLGALVRRAEARGWDVPLPVGLELLRDVARGLAAAHEARDVDGRPLELVHRDLSPENVLVGRDGVARLADFGIARALGRATETTREILKGKRGYMAPEVLRFEEPTPRSDLFAFGVVLFETLAGRRLYPPPDGARRILSEPPPDLLEERPDAPPALVGLLFALLAPEPGSRPESARAVATALEEALARASVDEDELTLARDWLDALLRRDEDEDATLTGIPLP